MTTTKATTTRARKTTTPRKTTTKPQAAVETIPEVSQPVTEASETILIHFVAEGFSAFGHVWSRGQEVEITKPSLEYDRTCDANGKSWLFMTQQEQIDRWGEIKFGRGSSPLPNSVINYKLMPSDGNDSYGRPKYTGYMSQVEREQAAEAEKARGRSIPVF